MAPYIIWGTVSFIVILLLIAKLRSLMTPPVVFSHWFYLIENFQHSPQEFYELATAAIQNRQIADCEISRFVTLEAGLLSASREYLRVTRKGYVFDICGAPFGNGFFISWWLGEKITEDYFWRYFPFMGKLFFRQTYYRIDTALMFQQAVHNAVLEVMDDITKERGLRALTEGERKPILKEFFKR